MVKEASFLKQRFFKNDNPNGGAMLAAIASAAEAHVILHSQTKKLGRLWGTMPAEKALACAQANHGLYEVLAKFPLKPYFDIDQKRRGEDPGEFLNLCKSQISAVFPDGGMAISGSVTDDKLSYHIVLNNYLIANEEDLKRVKTLVRGLHAQNAAFDWKVYTKNRNMKMVNQSKLDGRIQQVIEESDLRRHFISAFFSPPTLDLPQLPEDAALHLQIERAKKPFNLSRGAAAVPALPASFCNNGSWLGDGTEQQLPPILQALPISEEFDHTYTHYVARFCFHSGMDFDTFWRWIQRKKSGPEYCNKWRHHWGHLEKFPPVSLAQIKRVVYKYHPHLKVEPHFARFQRAFDFAGLPVTKIPRIGAEHFETRERFVIFNVGMGGGKTAQTIDYLKTKDSYLWIAPNIALAENTAKRIGDAVSLYTDFTPRQKKDGILRAAKKLIICQNSMHYVTGNYKIVVIDEIETLLLKFQGEFIDKNGYKWECWKNFLNVIRHAEKVVLLDAFTTTKTLNFIRNFSGEVVIYERPEEKTARTIVFEHHVKAQMLRMLEDLQAGKKLFVFYPPKRATKGTLSMASLYAMIEAETGAKGVFYNADINEEIKKGLQNVNKTWKEEQVIITNSCITCGVNYDEEDFDAIYLFIAKYSSPRDVIQVSYRPRHIKENKIYACFMGAGVAANAWHNDKAAMDCGIYSRLYDDCMAEFKSPQKPTFHYFCQKAGYAQELAERGQLEKDVDKACRKLLEKYNFCYDYSKVPDISRNQIDQLQAKIFTKTATMEEKLSLKKYFFALNFHWDADKGMLARIWDSQQMGVFDKMDKLRDENHFFHQLRRLNGWDSIFPPEEFAFEKVKVSDGVRAGIFEAMNFKWIGVQTSPLKLLKEAYNEFWGVSVIKTCLDENKHAIYRWGGKMAAMKELYEFGLKNYKNLGELEDDTEKTV